MNDMIRHSISQIFPSASTHRTQGPEMFPQTTLNTSPTRPRLPSISQPTPMYQQQTRDITQPSIPPSSSPFPLPQTLLSRPPGSQIEALPPWREAFANRFMGRRAEMDSAVRHPVFFTERFKKVPEGVDKGGGWGSPIARGYVFEGKEDGMGKRDGGKL